MFVLRILLFAWVAAYAASVEAATHVVRKGESLSSIARKYDVSVSAIEKANKIKDADKIKVGQKLQIPGATPVVIDYVIKKGDSLSTIASKHGISPKSLAAYNGIQNANKIRAGQTIKIPTKEGAETIKYAKLPSSVISALDKIRVKKGQWKYIVIHHSATSADRATNIARFHREERHMENGLAYHFVIENGTRGTRNGDIYIGDRWKKQIQGGHMKLLAHNQVAIGICLIGNFEKSRPKAKQMEQLEALVAYLAIKTDIPSSRIITHTMLHPNHTLCPGKYFPTNRLKSILN